MYLVGGRKGVGQTIKAVMYGATPSLLLGWLTPIETLHIGTIIAIIAGIWALIVGIIGVRQLHELSTGRAALAVILAIIIPAIILGAIIAALIATLIPMMP